MFHHQRRKISIFSQGEQILFVERINVVFGILVDHPTGNDDRATFIGGSNSVNTEAPR